MCIKAMSRSLFFIKKNVSHFAEVLPTVNKYSPLFLEGCVFPVFFGNTRLALHLSFLITAFIVLKVEVE